MKTIQFYRKQVYGKTYFYLKNGGTEILWEGLTGQKTLTSGDIILCKRLFEVEFEEVLADTAINAVV